MQSPIQYRYDHDLVIYQIRQKITFVRKLLVLESWSSSLTKPECIEEIANRLSIIENDFVDWATSQANDHEQEYEEKDAYSTLVADVEEMVSRVTEEKFGEGLEVILSNVNLEEINEFEENDTCVQQEKIDEFKATLYSKKNLEKHDGHICNQQEDQEKVGEVHEHEDKEACYEAKIVEELEGNLPSAEKETRCEENIDGSMKGQEDQAKVEQEHELDEKEGNREEKTSVESEAIVSIGNPEKIDQDKDEEEGHRHDKKETCCEQKVQEEMAVRLFVPDLDRIVSELIEKANKKEKRGGGWLRRLGAMGAAAVATVGLAIAIVGSVEELDYLVPT